jgi:hypothetical protein
MELSGRMKNIEIESKLKVFSFGRIQDAATLIEKLKKHGIPTDDFLAYAAEEKRRRVQAEKEILKVQAATEKRLPKCPSCGIAMILRPVHPPDPETGDPGDPAEGSHWTCKKCYFGKYDPRPVEEIRKSIGLE